MTNITSDLNLRQINFTTIDDVLSKYEETPSFFHPIKALWGLVAHHTLVRRKAALHYISDNGNYADVAAGEIRVRLRDAATVFQAITGRPSPSIDYHDIPSQDTRAAAFDLAQLSREAVRGFGNVFFVNCAPRKKERGNHEKNAGETIYVGILPNGAIVGGTGEEAFTHFKDLIDAKKLNIYKVDVATNSTQFRSRDYFPWLGVQIADYINRPSINKQWRSGLSVEERDQILFGLNVVNQDHKLSAKAIPTVPPHILFVERVDTHANLKLGIRHPALIEALGQETKAVIIANGVAHEASLTKGSFDKKAGTVVLSEGSSGKWEAADGKILPGFAEIFYVDDRARDLFALSDKDIKKGAEVHIIPASLFNAYSDNVSAMEGTKYSPTEIAERISEQKLVNGLDTSVLRLVVDNQSVVLANIQIIQSQPHQPIQRGPTPENTANAQPL